MNAEETFPGEQINQANSSYKNLLHFVIHYEYYRIRPLHHKWIDNCMKKYLTVFLRYW